LNGSAGNYIRLNIFSGKVRFWIYLNGVLKFSSDINDLATWQSEFILTGMSWNNTTQKFIPIYKGALTETALGAALNSGSTEFYIDEIGTSEVGDYLLCLFYNRTFSVAEINAAAIGTLPSDGITYLQYFNNLKIYKGFPYAEDLLDGVASVQSDFPVTLAANADCFDYYNSNSVFSPYILEMGLHKEIRIRFHICLMVQRLHLI